MNDKPIPKPLYPCKICYEECSWHATDLFWSEELCGWVCDMCWDEAHFVSIDVDTPDFGISLAEEIKRQAAQESGND